MLIVATRQCCARARRYRAASSSLRVPLEEIDSPEQVLEGREIEVGVGGLRGRRRAALRAHRRVRARGFALLLSGDAPPEQRTARATAASSGSRRTGCGAGCSSPAAWRRACIRTARAAAGVNGRGVLGFGPGAAGNARTRCGASCARCCSRARPTRLRRRSAAIRGCTAVELDWLGEWQALRSCASQPELDVFIPGRLLPAAARGLLGAAAGDAVECGLRRALALAPWLAPCMAAAQRGSAAEGRAREAAAAARPEAHSNPGSGSRPSTGSSPGSGPAPAPAPAPAPVPAPARSGSALDPASGPGSPPPSPRTRPSSTRPRVLHAAGNDEGLRSLL